MLIPSLPSPPEPVQAEDKACTHLEAHLLGNSCASLIFKSREWGWVVVRGREDDFSSPLELFCDYGCSVQCERQDGQLVLKITIDFIKI